MKRNFIIGLIAVLVVAGIVYAQTVNRQIYGVALPGLYKYTLSTNTQDSYLFSVPTLSSADTMVGLAATQTLTNKTLTSPAITSPTITGSPTIWGVSSYTVGDLLYASASTTLSKLTASTAGKFLRAAGTTTAPAWATLIIPNTATVGGIWYGSATNTISELAASTAGKFLRAAGTGTAPSWSTIIIPNTATVGGLWYASNTYTMAELAAVSAGSYLRSNGANTAPVYSTIKIPNTCTTGDLQYGSSSNILSPLPIGSTNQDLVVASGIPAWKDKNIFGYTAFAIYPTTAGILSAAEARNIILKITASDPVVAPSLTAPNIAGQIYMIHNSTSGTLTIKKSGGSGETLATGKRGLAYNNGTDYIVWTLD